MVAVADHQPPAVLVELLGVGFDVGGDLGLQRRGEHLPGAVAHDRVEQRLGRLGPGLVGLVLLVDYLEHGRTFPNQRVNAGPDQSCFDLKIILGKVRSFTSPGRGSSTGSDHCSREGHDRDNDRLVVRRENSRPCH